MVVNPLMAVPNTVKTGARELLISLCTQISDLFNRGKRGQIPLDWQLGSDIELSNDCTSNRQDCRGKDENRCKPHDDDQPFRDMQRELYRILHVPGEGVIDGSDIFREPLNDPPHWSLIQKTQGGAHDRVGETFM